MIDVLSTKPVLSAEKLDAVGNNLGDNNDDGVPAPCHMVRVVNLTACTRSS